MKSYAAYSMNIASAQNNGDFENTVLWIVFIIALIAPIGMIIIYISLAIAHQPRCPNCGSRKLKYSTKKAVEGHIITLEGATVCKSCKHEI